ncbi:MAG: nodulation protein NfeD [Anaerolineales bacterium]|nr:nodulation protein NfeD [Anaerolineales bacterium]MCX7756055.1 nodulation protein NfeD [Anaerolineales bacterium]MDW8278556.1 nodulation protein NfeD [Anaerolineales bacterium]
MKRLGFLLILLAAWLNLVRPVLAQTGTPLVLVLEAKGTVAPAMKEYITRGLKAAEQRGAELVVIKLNTPGGLISEMEVIVQTIRESRVPVVVYVSPRGGTAGSAGAIITIAAHASAMAPETIIGAASPISGDGQDMGETLERKQKEALRAQARALTENRPAEAVALAEEMIEIARAVSANEAIETGLIDFIANDLNDLLGKLDGFQVQMPDGARTLETTDARVESLSMSFIEQLLDILANPNITFLLITIGVQAILIEISSPGGWVAGFVGAVCLALAIYGVGILPVNWFGLIFLVLAFILFILEIKTPTFGALTAAGVGSLIVGALILFNSPGVPQFQRVSIPLVIATSIVIGASFAVLVGIGLRAQRTPVQTGQESLPGAHGVARTTINPTGQVHLQGELWSAELAEGVEAIQPGEKVEVVRVEGLRLIVRKIQA